MVSRGFRVGLGWASLIAFSFAASGSSEELREFQQTQRHMGTEVTVALYAPSETHATKGFEAAFARISQLDKTLSDYTPESELSRLSAASPTSAPVPVGEDLWTVLLRARQAFDRTEGGFDITVGPLTKQWRRSRRQRELPSEERLAEARAAVGQRYLRLHEVTRSVELTRPNMRLDAGGIGQGFAADEALAVLKRMGLSQVLINFSGDIAIGDPPPGKSGWRIGIAPLDADSPPSRFLELARCAISTSGDAFQFVEIAGQRYSHIVDPSTGLGLTRRVSVTVIAPNCTDADSLATGICVLGEERGLALVEKLPGVSALYVSQRDGKATTTTSQRFPQP